MQNDKSASVEMTGEMSCRFDVHQLVLVAS
jgi:hypothetical protein